MDDANFLNAVDAAMGKIHPRNQAMADDIRECAIVICAFPTLGVELVSHHSMHDFCNRILTAPDINEEILQIAAQPAGLHNAGWQYVVFRYAADGDFAEALRIAENLKGDYYKTEAFYDIARHQIIQGQNQDALATLAKVEDYIGSIPGVGRRAKELLTVAKLRHVASDSNGARQSVMNALTELQARPTFHI